MAACRSQKGREIMKIKLNCLSCGHAIELGDAYEDYHGEVRCWGCRATLEVSMIEGKLQAMRLLPEGQKTPSPDIEVLVLSGERESR
jgi:hypothetical protein